MKKKVFTLLLTSFFITAAVFASDNCNEPVNTWQPQHNLQQMLESNGWQVEKIKIDDGCYEVKGTDTLGNRFEAKYQPASLQIRELKITFNVEGFASDYLDKSTFVR
ncbi:PepSY domain-containing protein [Arsukibacterium perlucidum]|uniref:PepSY domain-containing protein n=1 Tax=Arsukibacterium perlucidum TaxID=368811 RepID=UPI0003717FB6|nr:PepSY domain-containing protein [Arsukibacterium perlucidum]